jgi:hypothetical protein
MPKSKQILYLCGKLSSFHETDSINFCLPELVKTKYY